MNETIFRGAHERVLDMPIFPETIQHKPGCPHAHKQEQELDDPQIIVRVNEFGSIELLRNLDDYLKSPAPVEMNDKEPLRVKTDLWGNISRG
jgi:hypothetical protein